MPDEIPNPHTPVPQVEHPLAPELKLTAPDQPHIPAEEPTPMLDVHLPHEPVHTWKDFSIHIATIVIGLIIAVGLEQTVEWVHHRQERQQLLRDIREEGASNAKICSNTVALVKATDDVYDAMADSIRAAPVVDGHVTLVIPPLVRQREAVVVKANAKIHDALLPTIPVWDTARETQAAALLSPESDRFFASLPYLLNWIDFDSRKFLDSTGAWNSLIRSLTGQPPHIVAPAQNTLTVTLEQRDRLLDVISRIQDAAGGLIKQLQTYEARSSAVADGVRDAKQYDQWAAQHGHQ